MWKNKNKQIFCPILLNDYIRGIPLFLFIVKEPIDKHQDDKCFVNQIVFQNPNMNAYSQKYTSCHFGR